MGEAYSFGNIHLEFVDVGCGSQTHSTIVLQFLDSLSEYLLICKGDCKMKPDDGKDEKHTENVCNEVLEVVGSLQFRKGSQSNDNVLLFSRSFLICSLHL